MPRVIQTRSVLAVRNLAVATDHYVNVLGFTRDPIDADGWSFLSLGSFKVMLGECPDAMPASALGDHSYFVHVMVEGVDDDYDPPFPFTGTLHRVADDVSANRSSVLAGRPT